MSFMFESLLFDDVLRGWMEDFPSSLPQTGFPPIDVFHEDGRTVIEIALAGYKANDIKVSVEGSKLTISSEGSSENMTKNQSQRRIAKRRFSSSWLDHNNFFDLQNLVVSFEDGILHVEVPKKASAKEKVFEVKTKSV